MNNERIAEIAREAVLQRTKSAPWATSNPEAYKRLAADVRSGSYDGFGQVRDAILGATAVADATGDLLGALREIVSQIDQGGDGGKVFARDACIARARVAIAKAEGRS